MRPLIHAAAAALLISAIPLPLAAGEADVAHLSGIVFEDLNGNGILDDGEPGVAGVMVSNQRDVVLTDELGRYTIPVEEKMTVFVIKPSGFSFPLNDDNLPLFYYHHFPEGSPDSLVYDGLEPTGPLPDGVDFALLRAEEVEEFDVLVMGDPQPHTDEHLDFLREGLVGEVRERDFAFGWALGDLMFDRLSLFPRYNALMGQIGVPLYNIIGNHDFDFEGDEIHAKDAFRNFFGPTYYAFSYGNVHFFGLDNIEWLGKQTENFWGDYRGVLGQQQIEWVGNVLEHIPQDDWIVFATHIPLYTATSTSERNNTVDREDLFAILEGRKNVLSLAAHTHTNEYYFLGPDHGWHGEEPLVHIVAGATSGAWWGGPVTPDGYPYSLQTDGVPSGYFVLRFSPEGFAERFVPFGRDPSFQIRVSTPRGRIAQSDLEGMEVVANVFAGHENTEVTALLNGETPIPLARTFRPDPFAAKVFAQFRETYRDWVGAANSTHIWVGELPSGLAPGVHRIDVEARFPDGRVYQERQVFEIVEE